MTTFVADIASYQQGLVPAALRPDCAALMIKCTQGSGYVDPDYASWLTEAKATALIPAAYHYLDDSPAVGQASNLAGHIIDESLPVMLDFEQSTLAQALDVVDAMSSAGLHPRVTYLSRSFWTGLGSPDLAAPFAARRMALINASYRTMAAGAPAALYPGDAAPEWESYGGLVPDLWQFTDAALEAGERIDMSAFRGSATQLAALLQTPAPAPSPTPTPSPGPAVVSWPTVRDGGTGPFVTLMQRALMLEGCDPHGVDGNYGAHTGAALEAAQRAFGISVDGVCGPVTWAHLRARTLTVQHALVGEGLGAGGTDATAGPLTAGEVTAFQRARKLAVDGIVGPETSRALGIAAP